MSLIVIGGANLGSAVRTNWSEVDSEVEMLALDARPGDGAIRTDLKKNFVLRAGGSPLVLADWIELAGAVDITINGVEPDTDGMFNLTPQDLGLTPGPVTPASIGAIAQPAGAVNGYILAVSNSSTNEHGYIPPGALSSIAGDTLVEGVAIYHPKREKFVEPKLTDIATAGYATQNFQAANDWVYTSSTGGTATFDPTVKITGAGSMLLQPGIHASTEDTYEVASFLTGVDLTTKYLNFIMWREDVGTGLGKLGAFHVEVSSNGTVWSRTDSQWFRTSVANRFGHVKLHKGSFTTPGTVDFTAITKVRLVLRTDSTALTRAKVWVDYLGVANSPAKAILVIAAEARLAFWDYIEMFYKRGFPINLGYRCSAHDNVTDSRMSTLQLKTLTKHFGCDASPISYQFSDADSTILSPSAVEASIAHSMQWGVNNGIEGAEELGWRRTNNNWMNTANAVANDAQGLQDVYTNLSVMLQNTSGCVNVQPPSNRAALSHQVFGSSARTNCQTYFQKVVDCKGFGVMQIDGIVPGSTVNQNIGAATMELILGDLAAMSATLDVISLTEAKKRFAVAA